MAHLTTKRLVLVPKKRRLKLTAEEAAGLARLKAAPKPPTPSGRARAAEFIRFAKSNPGW